MPRDGVCALILAAGLSTRMRPLLQGGSKALCVLDGISLLERCCSFFRRSGVEHIYVVTGHGHDKVAPAVSAMGAVPVYNEQYPQGMFSSITAGLAKLMQDDAIEAFFLLPVDIPLVSPAIAVALKKFWCELGQDHEQKRGQTPMTGQWPHQAPRQIHDQMPDQMHNQRHNQRHSQIHGQLHGQLADEVSSLPPDRYPDQYPANQQPSGKCGLPCGLQPGLPFGQQYGQHYDRKRHEAILLPVVKGEPGHPPLIGRAHWPGILAWDGKGGLQGYMAKMKEEGFQSRPCVYPVPVEDEAVLRDIDTPEDLEQAKRFVRDSGG